MMVRLVTAVSPSALALALFLLNSGVAMRRALGRGDAWAAAFVAAATALLPALLLAVRAHEREPEARRRGVLKAVAWALSAALTAMFAHRVAALSPGPAVAALVWTLAGSTVAAGGFFLLVHGEGGHAAGTDVVVAGDRRQYM